MDVFSILTVFFEDPFWVGVFERTQGGETAVCRVVFGAEPRDAQVYDLVLRAYAALRFSPAVAATQRAEDARMNPKRMQRLIRRQLAKPGASTKAQQALQLERERQALARRSRAKERKEAQADARFALRQSKRKEKHRGH